MPKFSGRLSLNMYKDGVLTINNWANGQAKHPITGFGLIQNAEVLENKGIAKIKNRTLLDTSVTPTALPIAEVYDVYGNTYTLTGDTGSGVCYKNGTAIQSGLGLLGDLVIFKDYLWIRGSTTLSAYGPLNNSPQWFGNVATGFASGFAAKLLAGQDDYLYSTNGNNVAKIQVTPAGAGVAPTLSTNLTALDLPDGQMASCLEEYGTKIAIGTHGGGTFAGRGNYQTARLYFWNRQLGTLGNPGLADLPIIFNENGVNAIKQHANKLYLSVGTQGSIYITDSTNYVRIARLPYAEDTINFSSTVYPNALTISPQGTLLVGLSGSLETGSRPGVYEIDIESEGYPVQFRRTTSNNEGALKIGFLGSKTYQSLNIGWTNNSSYGVDTTDFRMYPDSCVIETQLYRVGGYNSKKTFEFVEFQLSSALVNGQSIKISYRRNDKEDYTEIKTWTFASIGPVMSFEEIAGIADVEYIQLKIELFQDLATSFGNNVNLTLVGLR